jgi:hypothetical protein
MRGAKCREPLLYPPARAAANRNPASVTSTDMQISESQNDRPGMKITSELDYK